MTTVQRLTRARHGNPSADATADVTIRKPDTSSSTPATGGAAWEGVVPSGPERNGGLPDVVFASPHAKVVHGTDPGDFYCEHMFFMTQKQAHKSSSSVACNRHGEKLVGFLHIPWDAFTDGTQDVCSQAERHRGTREVVASALRGFFQDVADAHRNGAVRIMLNGYDTFQTVRNNPTGDFVTHRENLDAAMKLAFGTALITPEGQPHTTKDLAKDSASSTWHYVVREPVSGKERSVLIHTQRFAVADETINGTPGRSVQSAMTHFKPHAVLSMGVASDCYMAEFHADSGGMKLGRKPAHQDGTEPVESLPDNRSLARAILRGHQLSQGAVPASHVLTGGWRNV